MGDKSIVEIEGRRAKGKFVQKIIEDLSALERLLKEKKLEKDNARIGAELELNFLDSEYAPFPIGLQLLKKLADHPITTEYARFNLEINAPPLAFSGNCLSRLKKNINTHYNSVLEQASKKDARVLLCGIIPTLTKNDIPQQALTPEDRFKALYKIRKRLHGKNYEFNIRGMDTLVSRDNLMLFAGTTTSYQMHLQIPPDELVDSYNWAQMISGPLLAAATYSPLFLGKRLWHETRIALFEQSTDVRNHNNEITNEQPRVSFGTQWIKDSILELFHEDLAIHEPLFVCEDTENPLDKINKGQIPELKSWRFFNGSIYRWNRVCYGIINNKPSLRIENRILPAGPTMEDQMANTAFWLGMMRGLPKRYKNLPQKLSFDAAKHNFMKAARAGLEVQFKWVNNELIPAQELILEELLPIAHEGLQKADINPAEANHYLTIIEERVRSQKTGSNWMIENYNSLLSHCKQNEALVALTSGMITRQETDQPVHTWPPVEANEAGWKNRCNHLHRFMTTSLYKISEDTVVDLAAHMMEWKKIGHILVVDGTGKLVGLINKDAIINFLLADNKQNTTRVSEIMIDNPITAAPDTPLREAIQIILNNDISSLPIVIDQQPVGIVTKHDFVAISKFLAAELDRETT